MDAHVSSIIWYIIEDPGWLNWSHQNIKIFGLVNFQFMTLYDSIGFLINDMTQRKKSRNFLFKDFGHESQKQCKYIPHYFHSWFQIIPIFQNIFEIEQISFEFIRSFICNLILFDSIIFTLPKPSIMSIVLDMILTLTFAYVKLENNFFM